MKKINFALKMMGVLILFWISYNTYFGWNFEPINENELICDLVYKYGTYIAIFIYFLPLVDVYQKFIKEYIG